MVFLSPKGKSCITSLHNLVLHTIQINASKFSADNGKIKSGNELQPEKVLRNCKKNSRYLKCEWMYSI